MISSDTPSEKNCISRSSDRLSKGSTASSGSVLVRGVATVTDAAEPSAKASIVSVILSSCRLPRETRRAAKGPRIVRRTSADTNTEPGSLRAIRAGRDVDAVAEEVAVGLHHDIAQMHADPHLGLALVCEGERGSTAARLEPNSSMKPSPAVLNTRPPCAVAMPSITRRSAATSAVVLASSASVRAE
jgi:hypothetical protein